MSQNWRSALAKESREKIYSEDKFRGLQKQNLK